MKIIRTVKAMQGLSQALRAKGKSIGFVPTMGYLHQGHLSLVKASKAECALTVMSIYVNPLQFGPKEDFNKYPRDLTRDALLAKSAGVDYLFVPADKDMYPGKFLTCVDVAQITGILEGASRQGHFKGVATVVTKLFNIVLPDCAYFGQKDAQQAAVIRKMTGDLNFPVRIRVMPIVREKDGLAMSSRNKYLNALERRAALILFRSLLLAKEEVKNGNRESKKILLKINKTVKKEPLAKIDYFDIVNPETLEKVRIIKNKVLVAGAVHIGKTRLIDNIVVS